MGYLCDFCGDQRSIVYCRSDAASLCLSCDHNVHSANALSKRHSRTLSCEKCNSQPAFVRCIEERISLCQNCDWIVHVATNTSSLNTSSSHKRQVVHCYTGCPSAAELSDIWSFLLDGPSVGNSTCERGIGSMSITGSGAQDSRGQQEKSNTQDESVVRETTYLHDEDRGIESMTSLLDAKLQNADQMAGSSSLSTHKAFLLGSKGPCSCEHDAFYDDLNMDEVDLSIKNYEELFGVTYDQEQLFDNDGIEELFGTQEMSVSNCDGGYTAAGSSVGRVKVMRPACSTAASADSVANCKTEPNICYTRQHSFSGVTGECSTGDYQDCGASSMLIMEEPLWYPPGAENAMPPSSRNDAVMRYMEKKKTRKFDKKVRYASRKARADVRRRVKGRFVKAGEAYDYDPLSQTRSY